MNNESIQDESDNIEKSFFQFKKESNIEYRVDANFLLEKILHSLGLISIINLLFAIVVFFLWNSSWYYVGLSFGIFIVLIIVSINIDQTYLYNIEDQRFYKFYRIFFYNKKTSFLHISEILFIEITEDPITKNIKDKIYLIHLVSQSLKKYPIGIKLIDTNNLHQVLEELKEISNVTKLPIKNEIILDKAQESSPIKTEELKEYNNIQESTKETIENIKLFTFSELENGDYLINHIHNLKLNNSLTYILLSTISFFLFLTIYRLSLPLYSFIIIPILFLITLYESKIYYQKDLNSIVKKNKLFFQFTNTLIPLSEISVSLVQGSLEANKNGYYWKYFPAILTKSGKTFSLGSKVSDSQRDLLIKELEYISKILNLPYKNIPHEKILSELTPNEELKFKEPKLIFNSYTLIVLGFALLIIIIGFLQIF